jgi:hypothetical protein
MMSVTTGWPVSMRVWPLQVASASARTTEAMTVGNDERKPRRDSVRRAVAQERSQRDRERYVAAETTRSMPAATAGRAAMADIHRFK